MELCDFADGEAVSVSVVQVPGTALSFCANTVQYRYPVPGTVVIAAVAGLVVGRGSASPLVLSPRVALKAPPREPKDRDLHRPHKERELQVR